MLYVYISLFVYLYHTIPKTVYTYIPFYLFFHISKTLKQLHFVFFCIVRKYLIDIIVYKTYYNYVLSQISLNKDIMKKETNLTKSSEDHIVTLRVKRPIIDLIDKERSKFSAPRSTWITQAIVEKLEKLGYEIE